jgi:UDP-N-acetylglucosamine 2-epimerase|tara:strand:- start:928 stop:2040 length:1113 start_codon:yes stop_codon:yes gene_type:complete
MKILTIVGTRPEIIKMSLTIKELDKNFTNILVNTNQNFTYELSKIFFEDLKIRKPDYQIEVRSNTHYETISKTIKECGKIIEKENPECLVILGDTNSCYSALAAKKLGVPIFHLEAGNRCFDENVPEEINRRIIDHTSEINLVYTEHARQNLIREGIHPQTIIKTGSPMYEVLNYYKNKINASKVLKKYKLVKNKYVVVSIHRNENLDIKNNFFNVFECIEMVSKNYNGKIVVSTHPGLLARLKKHKKLINFNKIVNSLKPLSFTDYIALQKNSDFVISDSGTLMEETAILKTKSIMIRNSHERPEGMDTGTLLVSGLDKKNLHECINLLNKNKKNSEIPIDYLIKDFSKKISKIILSYFGYIKFFHKKN